MKQNKLTLTVLAFCLSCLLAGFLPEVKAQGISKYGILTIEDYKPDTTYLPFRGDTLIILDGWTSYLSADGRIILANLDFFGLEYWGILKKHNLKFEDYLQKQIDDIMEYELWVLTEGKRGKNSR